MALPGSQKPQVIEFTFAPDGSTKIETTGFAGKGCQAASLPYEQALGAKTSDIPTAEARDTPEAPIKATIKNKLG